MDIMILDKSYNAVAVVDTYISFIWTDRFNSYGDFELYAPVEVQYRPYLVLNNYLWQRDSDRLMIIESISIKSDPETGNTLTVTGRSLESILDRRVIWGYKKLTGNFQTAIQTILNDSIISPSNSKRKIPNFKFTASTDKAITDLTIDSTEYFGEGVYETIQGLCETKKVGFRVLPDEETDGFNFELYLGKDRSWSQNENPPVIFSYKYQNLLESNYIEKNSELKTAALVGGSGEGSSRTMNEVLNDDGGGEGLDRREIYVSSSGTDLTTEGKEAIKETETIIAFEGEVGNRSEQFMYNRDFFLGDLVEVMDEYGNSAVCQVSEVVRTSDGNEDSLYPTFTSAKKEEEE